MESKRHLDERSGGFMTLGARLLLLGGVAALVGALLAWPGADGSVLEGLGVMLMALAAVPTLAGIALMLSGLTAGRVAREKPFA